jgi:phospholipid transport system substrate-binding protein
MSLYRLQWQFDFGLKVSLLKHFRVLLDFAKEHWLIRRVMPAGARHRDKRTVITMEEGSISRRRFAGIVAGALVLPLLGAGSAFAATPEAYIKGIGANVLVLANGPTRGKALRAKFANLLGQYVNLNTIAGSALGPYRARLPASDKEKFRTLVTTYAAALFVYYVERFQGTDIAIDSVANSSGFTIVKSHIVKGGIGGEQVTWYLAKSGNSYQVVDLSILGVRLSVAMRDSFGRELRKSKGDFRALYAFLAEAETW